MEEAIRAVVDYCARHYGPLSFGGGSALADPAGWSADAARGRASLLDEADFTAHNLGDATLGAAGRRGDDPSSWSTSVVGAWAT